MTSFDEVKQAAGKFLRTRKLTLTSGKGFEALLAFYCGWYRTEDGSALPPYVAICLSSGRHKELIS